MNSVTLAQELDAALKHFYPDGLTTGRSSYRPRSLDGYHAGREAAKGIGIHRGIGQGRPGGYLT